MKVGERNGITCVQSIAENGWYRATTKFMVHINSVWHSERCLHSIWAMCVRRLTYVMSPARYVSIRAFEDALCTVCRYLRLCSTFPEETLPVCLWIMTAGEYINKPCYIQTARWMERNIRHIMFRWYLCERKGFAEKFYDICRQWTSESRSPSADRTPS